MNLLIAGGGTGGHIYPAVAIAKAFKQKYPESTVHFVGAIGGLENKIVPREGFELSVIRIGKLHASVGLWVRLKTALMLPLAFFQCVKLCFKLKPDVILGVGGYASGPMVLVGACLQFKTLIWEPNAYPGLTNRILARFVDEALVVFESAKKFLPAKKVSHVGLPVRSTFQKNTLEESGPLRILITGGSQGARGINMAVSEAVQKGGAWMKDIEIIHQTGPLDFVKVKERYQNAGPNFSVVEYIHDMSEKFSWASMVVCRAGASTVAEVCAVSIAAVFVPLPTAADDHQRKNAQSLVDQNAALMVLQKEFTADKFIELVVDLKQNRSRLKSLGQKAGTLHNPNATDEIVDRIVSYCAKSP